MYFVNVKPFCCSVDIVWRLFMLCMLWLSKTQPARDSAESWAASAEPAESPGWVRAAKNKQTQQKMKLKFVKIYLKVFKKDSKCRSSPCIVSKNFMFLVLRGNNFTLYFYSKMFWRTTRHSGQIYVLPEKGLDIEDPIREKS